eukprot:52023_1
MVNSNREILYIFIGVWSGMAVLIPLTILIASCCDSGYIRPLTPLEEEIKRIRDSLISQTVRAKRRYKRLNFLRKKENISENSMHSTISINTDASGSANCCHICLEDFKPGDQISSSSKGSNCSHRFHTNCITAWLITPKIDCPVCRQEFVIFKVDDDVDEDEENKGESQTIETSQMSMIEEESTEMTETELDTSMEEV